MTAWALAAVLAHMSKREQRQAVLVVGGSWVWVWLVDLRADPRLPSAEPCRADEYSVDPKPRDFATSTHLDGILRA